ncbi:NAD(P)-binding domain-containing protein [Phytohabitans sp. ZYX-F-186]|uniref:NAD(P)-binding domain-containing protein n=1 Tax=Phytohabitans maris TaxID=3071409 RepID=A0ABU0ZAN4_9ACTN|nr:NAD(P)-binding domain-containing protein [Phytohabitans sp. ZYX-F-186]MDQ7904043.1 NAD(P)-binding domain-containing protein [Phytohabitans sp. ZYX-F-186]
MDYVVIGAGPAGLQLAHLLDRAGRDYLVVEAGPTPGTFYRTFPRHRRMISINKPHTGWNDPEKDLRVDWNSLLCDDPELRFTRYTGRYFPDAGDYLRYLADFARGLDVRYGTRVSRVRRVTGGFELTCDGGDVLRAARVVVATGFGAENVVPIPGVETAERYGDVPVDPAGFTDQRVLIVGKGNSAFETADNLTETAAVIHVAGPRSIRFAWRTHFIGHLRAVNNNFLDTYQLKTQNMVLDGDILRIERRPEDYLVTFAYARRNKVVDLAYDRVIMCTGFRMDASIFDDGCRPELTIDDRFPALTAQWESVNVPGLYFAGTLTQSRDFKRYTSAFIHGFRYGVRALSRMLDQKYHGVDWPHRTVRPAGLAGAVLDRINRTSALFQQFGFLCDVFTADGRYYEEMPLDYVPFPDCFTVSLEYGTGHDAIDPFDVEAGRAWEADESHDDRYLHPVVRCRRGGEVVATLRLPEQICNDWTDDKVYREPLREFVEAHA